MNRNRRSIELSGKRFWKTGFVFPVLEMDSAMYHITHELADSY